MTHDPLDDYQRIKIVFQIPIDKEPVFVPAWASSLSRLAQMISKKDIRWDEHLFNLYRALHESFEGITIKTDQYLLARDGKLPRGSFHRMELTCMGEVRLIYDEYRDGTSFDWVEVPAAILWDDSIVKGLEAEVRAKAEAKKLQRAKEQETQTIQLITDRVTREWETYRQTKIRVEGVDPGPVPQSMIDEALQEVSPKDTQSATARAEINIQMGGIKQNLQDILLQIPKPE